MATLNPEAEQRVRSVLWMSFAVSVVIYFILLQIQQPRQPEENPAVVTALMVIALGLVAASFAVKGWIARTGEDSAERRRKAFLLPIVMCEAAAIFGLVTRFAFGFEQYYWFLLLGLAGILLHYPKREN
jgi:F0F1-type ATP synthase membrane subunit c/vacuolar-type H+-ATPase subunit K